MDDQQFHREQLLQFQRFAGRLESNAAELGGEWTLEPTDSLLDLRGDPVDARVLVSGPVTVPSDTSTA